MAIVGVGISELREGAKAAEQAAAQARAGLHGAQPALVIVFASAAYPDLERVPPAVSAVFEGAPLLGGTSAGCVWGPDRIACVGVSVVAVGGPNLVAATASARIESPHLGEMVPIASKLVRDLDAIHRADLEHLTALVMAPGLVVDGEALAAAVRKGIGARAQLAGGLCGRANFETERVHVFHDGTTSNDRVVLAGIRSRRPLGVAARHGWKVCGAEHIVTRTDGMWLLELDRRPALDVWAADVRANGGLVPEGHGNDVIAYLTTNYELGLLDGHQPEPIVRAPYEVRADGAVRLSASIPEGMKVALVHGTRDDILNAAKQASHEALAAVGFKPAGGLILACTGLHAALGSEFPSEPSSIRGSFGAATGGACVFGEIERARREVDAFHNATSVVVAFPRM